jgi:hypothetical protein
MKTALEIIQFLSYSSNAEVSKVSSWANVKPEALNGLNRALRVVWNSKEWNFRREIKKVMVTAGKSSVSIANFVLAQNGLRINNNKLEYDREIPFYDTASGTPTKFYITNKDKIVLYPVPDERLTLVADLYNTMPVLATDGTLKSTFTAGSDVLNLPERLENLFIDCLNYFCNEILNGDVTDEEYQEAQLRYSEVYKLLEKYDLSTLDKDDNKGFLMPWQLLK